MRTFTNRSRADRLAAGLLVSAAVLPLVACGETAERNANQSAQSDAADPVASGKPLTPVPSQILIWADNARGECVSVGGKPRLSSDPVPEVVADLNGDKKDDFVVLDGFMECDGALAYFMSGQVPNYTVFISAETGYRETGISSMDVSAKKLDGRNVLILSTVGPGAYERSFDTYAVGWDGKEMARLAFYDAKGGRVNEDGSPWRPGAATPTAFPPIPKGYYAVGTTCARAADADAASAGPGDLAYFDQDALTWFDGGPMISGFEPLGDNRFRVRARSFGNGDDDKGTKADFVIRITGASSFVTEPGSFLFDRQETFTHCPATTVPKAVRDWFGG